MFIQSKNKGLPYKFTLDKGKFLLVGGAEKAQDSLRFMLSFIGWYRVYFPDYIIDIDFLVQKNTSRVQSFKTLLLGRMQVALSKYLPFISIDSINSVYEYNNRKGFGIVVTYTYDLESEARQDQVVTFVDL